MRLTKSKDPSLCTAGLKVLMSCFHDLVLFGALYGLNVEIEKDFLSMDAQHDTRSLLIAYNQI
jgi:uncharacterized protein (DUF2345 family)